MRAGGKAWHLALGSALVLVAQSAAAWGEEYCGPGELGGPGLALRATKVLTVAAHGRTGAGVIDHGLVLVRDGRIEAVGPAQGTSIPAGYQVRDFGEHWLMPGLVELHSHVAGTGYNDSVYQTNPGLRASATVIPERRGLKRATAGGVTTLLFIPGSATNMGGQGVLLKPGLSTYAGMLVRAPGSLKIAQGDNPKRWGYGMQRTLMAWNLRQELRAGLAYARRWEAHQRGEAERPARVMRYDVFRDLLSGHTQVSTHTQYYRLVLTTIEMLREEFGLDVYIDHGSFDSYKTAELAEEKGVAAILGPREILWPRPSSYRTGGRVEGSAWGFQRGGHQAIGFMR